MSADALHVAQAIPRLRNDGAQIELTFSAPTRNRSVVVLDREQLPSLIKSLMAFLELAHHSAMVATPADAQPATFEKPPALLHVKDLTLIAYDESKATSIRIESVEGPRVQLTLLPHHVKFLRDSLQHRPGVPQPQDPQ